MQDDLTDGVQWLIAQGIADPKCIGIYGVSYGGYAALAGITFTPDLVRGGRRLRRRVQPVHLHEQRSPQLEAHVGKNVRHDRPPRKGQRTPGGHVSRAAQRPHHAPLLVAQGAMDSRVNKAESDQMVEALRERGVEVQYMVEENEGHGYRNEENTFKFYGATEKFLTYHLKPRQHARS